MAIIDILTHYDAKKKAAHAAKTVKHGVSISVLFPSQRLGPRCRCLSCWDQLQAGQSPSVVLVPCGGAEYKLQGQQMAMLMPLPSAA